MTRTRQHRRGVAIIIVLTMISIALAISYSMLRLESTTLTIQQNSDRGADARTASMVGLAAALRAMHLSTWTGVGTSLTGTISSTDSYTATFTAGDASLSVGASDYWKWHYRVTVTVVGRSVSTTNSQIVATHTRTSVVEMVPKAVFTPPTNWSNIRNYTLYQISNGACTLDVPCRVEGALRLQGAVNLGTNYSWSTTARNRYMGDLNDMRYPRNEVQTVTVGGTGGTYRLVYAGQTTNTISRSASPSTVRSTLEALSNIGNGDVAVGGNSGGPYTVTFTGNLAATNVDQLSPTSIALTGIGAGVNITTTTQGIATPVDWRPINGPVSLPRSSSSTATLSLMENDMSLVLTNITVSSAMSLPLPQTLNTYRIYPGGPTYNVPQVSSNLSNITLAPDPQNNPLGIYFCRSTLTVGNNVSVTGTLITGSSMTITGTNVTFAPVSLRPLTGTTTPHRLPVAVARQVFEVDSAATVTVNGFVVAGADFRIDAGTDSASYSQTGRVVCNAFTIGRRDSWNFAGFIWTYIYSQFTGQASDSDGTDLFPLYLWAWGCDPQPRMKILPDTTTSQLEHWQDLNSPVYAKLSSDPGLFWDIISTTVSN